ncbi:MAG: hypothetical protein AAF593_13565 [Planctomycetota bacterium]
MRRFGFILLGVLALPGCISAVPPSVEVVGAEWTDQSPQGARVEVALVLSNSNNVAIQLPETSYTLAVGDTGSYAYIDIPGRVLGPKGVQALRLPAAFETDGRSISGEDWRINGTLTYAPENYLRNFLTETGVPLPLVLFSGNGTLD